MPEVFVNTTPLQSLHRLGRLDWLHEFYGRVVVPGAVADELEAGRRLGAKVPDVAAHSWIEIGQAPQSMPVFPRFIHRGEAELLALAQMAGDALVIIDDAMARTHARTLGLRITGTLGLVLRAKREKRIDAVAPLLTQLRAEGFHLAPATLAEVLRLAGE